MASIEALLAEVTRRGCFLSHLGQRADRRWNCWLRKRLNDSATVSYGVGDDASGAIRAALDALDSYDERDLVGKPAPRKLAADIEDLI